MCGAGDPNFKHAQGFGLSRQLGSVQQKQVKADLLITGLRLDFSNDATD